MRGLLLCSIDAYTRAKLGTHGEEHCGLIRFLSCPQCMNELHCLIAERRVAGGVLHPGECRFGEASERLKVFERGALEQRAIASVRRLSSLRAGFDKTSDA